MSFKNDGSQNRLVRTDHIEEIPIYCIGFGQYLYAHSYSTDERGGNKGSNIRLGKLFLFAASCLLINIIIAVTKANAKAITLISTLAISIIIIIINDRFSIIVI